MIEQKWDEQITLQLLCNHQMSAIPKNGDDDEHLEELQIRKMIIKRDRDRQTTAYHQPHSSKWIRYRRLPFVEWFAVWLREICRIDLPHNFHMQNCALSASYSTLLRRNRSILLPTLVFVRWGAEKLIIIVSHPYFFHLILNHWELRLQLRLTYRLRLNFRLRVKVRLKLRLTLRLRLRLTHCNKLNPYKIISKWRELVYENVR